MSREELLKRPDVYTDPATGQVYQAFTHWHPPREVRTPPAPARPIGEVDGSGLRPYRGNVVARAGRLLRRYWSTRRGST